jgi:hypothetical protein
VQSDYGQTEPAYLRERLHSFPGEPPESPLLERVVSEAKRVQRRRRIGAILALVLVMGGGAWGGTWAQQRGADATAASIGAIHCPNVLPRTPARNSPNGTSQKGLLVGKGATSGFMCAFAGTTSDTPEPPPLRIQLTKRDLQRVIAELNASPVVPRGTYQCLLDDGSGYYLRLESGKLDHAVSVDATGCRFIRSNGTRVIRRAQPGLLQLLSDIVTEHRERPTAASAS